MAHAAPSSASRARGALLGLAAAGEGVSALASVLGEELLRPELDLARTVERWLAVEAAGAPLPPDLAAALRSLRERGAPPRPDEPGATGLAVHLAPVALLAHASPPNLLSGTFHLAALTHPSPAAAWAAVAFNVTLARLLQGFRDFVPDVTEALRTNEAPASLLDRLRRLPAVRREELEPASAAAGAQVQAALWLAHHEPNVERGLQWLAAAAAPPTLRGAAAALLGARAGLEAVEAGLTLVPAQRQPLRHLADRLARIHVA